MSGTDPAYVLPPELAERARACVRGSLEVTPLRRAATVALLRDGSRGLEAYLLRRTTSMAFAAGMHVFPGGAVDPRDADHGVGWAGPPPSSWATRLACEEAVARASVAAAVRETFEETGVVLAGPDAEAVVDDVSGADWEADRRALLDRTLALTDLLARRRLVLRADLLGAWGHWVTPRFEQRRYDTHFYVAALPVGQRTRDVGGEADHVRWLRPSVAVDLAGRGTLAMLPPTARTLRELSGYDSVAGALAGAGTRRIERIEPGWVDDGEQVRVLLPGDQAYPGDAVLDELDEG